MGRLYLRTSVDAALRIPRLYSSVFLSARAHWRSVFLALAVRASPCGCELSHHIGLPGLLYVVRGDNDGDLPRLHDLHQMLPDPRNQREETKEIT